MNDNLSWLSPKTHYVWLVRLVSFLLSGVVGVGAIWYTILPSNIWEALIAVFPLLIVGWYWSKWVSAWYAASYWHNQHTKFLLAAMVTDPMFLVSYARAANKIDPEYLVKLADPKFLDQEIKVGNESSLRLMVETVEILTNKQEEPENETAS